MESRIQQSAGDYGSAFRGRSQLIKARDDLHVEWIEQEAVILDPVTAEIHYLNGPAALVFGLIQEHGYEAALKELRGRTDAPDDEVKKVVEDMIEKGLLIDD